MRQWFYRDEYTERLGKMPAVFDKDPDQQVVHIGWFKTLYCIFAADIPKNTVLSDYDSH